MVLLLSQRYETLKKLLYYPLFLHVISKASEEVGKEHAELLA